MNKIPVSAVVVSCNEGHMLFDCLSSVQFCQEIICVDLESVDNTKEIADSLSTKYLRKKRVPVIEHLYPWIASIVENNWVLLIDPDEFLTKGIQNEIIKIFDVDIPESIGKIMMPWQFFFGKHKVIGTYWGNNKLKGSLLHKGRNDFGQKVHKGSSLIVGFESKVIDPKNDVYIHHKWMHNFSQLFEKHRRYIPLEAINRFEEGHRYKTKLHLFFWTALAFYRSFVNLNGYKDKYQGFLLSLFWAWYNYKSFALLKYMDKK